MKLKVWLFVAILFTSSFVVTQGQSLSNIEFFNVQPKDFEPNLQNVDATLGAVIIADIGSCDFESNSKGEFVIVYKRKTRIKVINKMGFDLSSVMIPLYQSKSDVNTEDLSDFKAVTYNLEDGKVVPTQIDKSAIFTEKINNSVVVKKFTMPAVKEGSIIEYAYTVQTDFLFAMQPWDFQGKFPRLWSEYDVSLPSFFIYVSLIQGYQPFYIDSSSTETVNYVVRDGSSIGQSDRIGRISSANTMRKWVMKDVPAIKEEKFITTLDNYISRIQFQLSATNFNNQYRDVMGSWANTTATLMKRENFGAEINKERLWIDEDLKKATKGAQDRVDEARLLFMHVRDHFKCNKKAGIWLTQSFNETYKSKAGSISDINIMLVSLLKHNNFDAQPVLLSTRDNGLTSSFYPLIQRFNYVICRVLIDGKVFLLDASLPFNGFNKLQAYCYNGHSRIIDQIPMPIYLQPDSIKEKELTSIMLFSDTSGAGVWTGTYNNTMGYDASSDLREYLLSSDKAAYIKRMGEGYSDGISISDVTFDHLNDYDDPVEVSYNIKITAADADALIYFNPMLKQAVKENPFKSAVRQYPVEIPFKIDDIYLLRIEIPKGYKVDDKPASAKVTLNENEGMFEYIVEQSDTELNVRSRVKIDKTFFSPEDYESIRNFYDLIVKKHAEQIVFKKL